MLELIKTEKLFDTTYQEYKDEVGNIIIIEDGIITMLNEYVLDSHGQIIT